MQSSLVWTRVMVNLKYNIGAYSCLMTGDPKECFADMIGCPVFKIPSKS